MARDQPGSTSFGRLFRTKRLTFRALENSPEHTSFLRDLVMDDPETYAQSTDRLLAPVAIEEVENDVAGLVNSLLAVIICQRPTSENGEPRDDDDEDDGHEGEGDKGASPPPTAIGWLTLSCHALTLHHRSCTLGIMIASAHQGAGYGTEAVNWALDWAFRVAGMHAVRLSCFSFNERAVELYERLGFVREGVTREAYYFDCRWYDRVLYSILDREWVARRSSRKE